MNKISSTAWPYPCNVSSIWVWIYMFS